MPTQQLRTTTHHIEIAAPADTVYGLLADATRWPVYFRPNVHVERLEGTDRTERLQMWATAGGQVKNWISRRDLDPVKRTIGFRQEVFKPPVAAMLGEWQVEATGAAASALTLRHEFAAVDDNPDDFAWLTDVTNRNSTTELANVKALAERGDRLGELVFSFADEVTVNGSGEDVYEFLYRADEWPRRLPHVSRLDLTEDPDGVQTMIMDTRTKDGSTHTTESIRVCFGPDRIVYKQTVVPALMNAHTGEWTVVPDGDGVRVISRHTVEVKESAIASVLGADASVETARSFLRKALGGNSSATLALAKEFAEGRRG